MVYEDNCFSNPQATTFACLAEHYIQDPDFTTIEGQAYPRMGEFLKEAMDFWCADNFADKM
ncbi:MAG: hypothetical protein DA408_16165 [Bacteroidetes bacterium]|nr:MAG: hypothetical protein C7N36_10365 [Bacteroidota bacterium]PTM10383.1 MAG: hypothetical protein DA408_16165 [Bacteroidota bacterium]